MPAIPLSAIRPDTDTDLHSVFHAPLLFGLSAARERKREIFSGGHSLFYVRRKMSLTRLLAIARLRATYAKINLSQIELLPIEIVILRKQSR